MIKVNVWIRLMAAIPAALMAQWALAQLAGMFLGLALNDSGAPVSIRQHWAASAISSSLAFVFITVLFTAYFDRQPLEKIGMGSRQSLPNLLTGLSAATFVLALVTGTLAATGMVQFSEGDAGVSQMIVSFLAMLAVALGEECFFRGYIQRNLQEAMPPLPALLTSATLFMVLHMGNPGQNLLALPGIFAGGMLLGINYLFTGNLWFGIALHAAWNFGQGPVLGFAVSGIALPAMLSPTLSGPAWLTGGQFGAEASLLTVLLNLGLTGWLGWHYARMKRTHSFNHQQ
jgi:membrane protease YdiL (CAAX protease family)